MAFTKSYEVVGFGGKVFVITDSYSPSATGSEAVDVDTSSTGKEQNNWVRRSGVTIKP